MVAADSGLEAEGSGLVVVDAVVAGLAAATLDWAAVGPVRALLKHTPHSRCNHSQHS